MLITALALARLVALRARADVLVDGHWLSALARAQRRMGFKHGTALLTSNELASPISWGLMRPVILLNTRAVEASGEAEAIIAHELAHVARMDWAKLLLARVATALFWFNPFVWMLAREAHQLREEAADDAVLGADIAETDYAQLLVGVARHECPGLLLGAHGVAPSKSSLARRVARVLDGSSVRGPAARGFAAGVFVGAVLVAAPLAALTLTPAGMKSKADAKSIAAGEPQSAYYPAAEAPADLPHIIASGVSTSVQTAVAAVSDKKQPDFQAEGSDGASVVSRNGVLVASSPSGASAIIYPQDAHGRRKVVATSASGARTTTYIDSKDIPTVTAAYAGRARAEAASARAAAMAAIGVTPEYVAQMRSVGHRLAALDQSEFAEMRAVGVTPEFARDLFASGFPGIDADDLVQARAVGLTGGYVRAMRSAGVRGDFDDFIQLRAVGIDPGFRGARQEIRDDESHRRRPRRAPERRLVEAACAAGSAEGSPKRLGPARPRPGRLTLRPPPNNRPPAKFFSARLGRTGKPCPRETDHDPFLRSYRRLVPLVRDHRVGLRCGRVRDGAFHLEAGQKRRPHPGRFS